jgi:hypothetical protein
MPPAARVEVLERLDRGELGWGCHATECITFSLFVRPGRTEPAWQALNFAF